MKKSKFNDYKLSNELLKAIDMLGFTDPTNVQKQVIPSLLENEDIIVKSQTGSGKTAAFAIPICQHIDWENNKPQALILTPTRELANQVKEDIFNIGRFKRIKVVAVYGKSPIKSQIKDLKQKTHFVVGTPGRIIDHIDRGTLDLSDVKYFVLDEADEMLNMGFIEQIQVIIDNLPKERVTALLSATMPRDIKSLCDNYMKDPIFVEIEDQDRASDRIYQERYTVSQSEKIELLKDITIIENPDSCIVFCNTRKEVDDVNSALIRLNYASDKIHGGMEQDDRTKVMNNFKKGKFRYLIATDVAARGIDIDDISLVINYDIPQDSEVYIHRIGRTGRKSNEGRAITFVTKNEGRFLNDVHEAIETEIDLKEKPEKDLVLSLKAAFDEKMSIRPELKEVKGSEMSKEIMKLHINAGKKTKMRATDIVGTLCNLEGMTADDIGIISIIDVSTFVEILNNKGEFVYDKLQTTPIKGRLRNVSKANS